MESEVINYFARRESEIASLKGYFWIKRTSLVEDFNINQRLMNINEFKFLVDLLFPPASEGSFNLSYNETSVRRNGTIFTRYTEVLSGF